MKRVILTEKNFSRLKEFVKLEKGNEIIFTSDNDDLNRKVAEKLPIQIVMIPLDNRRDYTKQRDSGMNEVIAKIFKKNKIILGIDFEEVLNSEHKERIFARIRQNVDLCKRLKVQIKFIYNENKFNLIDLKAFGNTLGMPTWMTNNF